MKKQNIKILDCSFRDGGYYNNWKFSFSQFNEYVSKIIKSNIDVIEIGFRFLNKNRLFGPFAFCEEKIFSKIKYLDERKIKIAIMVNSDDFLNTQEKPEFLFNKYFTEAKKSKISIIRFATRLDDIESIGKVLKLAKHKGYKVFLNLMQINRVSNTQLKKCLQELKKINSIDVFYFADTFGSLMPNQIENICNIIKRNCDFEFGIHAHDNCGFALENSLRAVDSGANWIDCTLQGMGRGAGNLSTENIVCELSRRGIKKFKPETIYSLSQSFFLNLKKKFRWGASIYYHLAAINNIHPSYIQELQIDNRYSHDEIINIINQLKKINATSFNPYFLKSIINQKIDFKKTFTIKDIFLKKKIVLLGQGLSLLKEKKKILRFIKRKKCIVISLNINKFFKDHEIDYYLASDKIRIFIDHLNYRTILEKIILPQNLLKDIIKIKDFKKIKNYPLIIDNNKIKSHDNYCILPNTLVIGYALALLNSSGAKYVYMAGFDGYKNDPVLQVTTDNYLQKLKKTFKKIKLVSLTPTTYSLPAKLQK